MTRALGSAAPKLRSAAGAAAFATLYFLTAQLTSSLIGDPGIAVLWPASGVYLGVMLVAPREKWPLLACAAGIGSLAAYLYGGSSLELSVAFAVPSSAEGLLAALLVERIAGRRFQLGGLGDLMALVVGGAVVGNGLVALSAAAVAAQTFDTSFADSWLRWWSADALGMIAVAPIIAGGVRAPRVVALAGLAAGLIATHLASQVYAVQGFLAVLLLGSLAFAVELAERARAREELARADAEIERRRLAADQASNKLEGTTEELGAAGRRVAQLTAELAARSAELHVAERRRDRMTDELRDSRAESARLVDELSRANAERGELGEDLSRATAERAELADELSRVTAERAELADELSRSEADGRALEAELGGARAEQARAGEALGEAVSGRRRAEQELELVAGRLERVRAELQRTQQTHGQTEHALELARAQFAEQRERLERSLEEANQSVARAQAERPRVGDHGGEMTSRYDDRGTCLYASHAFCRLLGYEPGELVGRPGSDLLHPHDRSRLARARATKSRSTFEGRLRRKAGEYVWVEVSLEPVLAWRDDRLVEIKTTVRDISEARPAHDTGWLGEAPETASRA